MRYVDRRDELRMWSDERRRAEPLKFLMLWDASHPSCHTVKWDVSASSIIAPEALVESIILGTFKLTPSVMKRIRDYPQIQRIVLRAIFLKQTGVKEEWRKYWNP